MDLYDIARQVTDEVMGQGTYEKVNGADNPNPGIRRAIKNAPFNKYVPPKEKSQDGTR